MKLKNSDITSLAKKLYASQPTIEWTKQILRTYICPFDIIINAVPKESEILDIGCGSGLFLGLVSSIKKIDGAFGFDYSKKAIDTANSMKVNLAQKKKISFRVGNAKSMLKEKKYSVVSMIDVIHHIQPRYQKKVVIEAIGMIKENGLYIYKDMARKPRWKAYGNRLHDLIFAQEWIHYFPVKELEDICINLGLELIHSSNYSKLWYQHELRIFRKNN